MKTRMIMTLFLVVVIASGALLPANALSSLVMRESSAGGALEISDAFPAAALQSTTITLQPSAENTTMLQDACLQEWYPDTNKGNDGVVEMGGDGDFRPIMRWDLVASEVPTEIDIQEAWLELYVSYRTRAEQTDISIYRVLRPWQESSVTWNLAQTGVPWSVAGCNGLGSDRQATAVSSRSILAGDPISTWYTWTVTSLVQDWVDNPSGNLGMVLISGSTTVRYQYMSAEGTASLRPKLVIRYTERAPTLTPTPSATPTPTATFTATPSATQGQAVGAIQGRVFEDLNLNGQHDPGEPGVVNARIDLQDNNFQPLNSRMTDADGRYVFSNLTPGTYCLQETCPTGFQTTGVSSVCLPVAAGDVFGFDFATQRTVTVTPTMLGAGTPTNTPLPSPTRTVTATPTRTPTPGPSPTPTITPESWIDVSHAIPVYCKGSFSGDTTGKPNNAEHYGDEEFVYNGSEDVYVLNKSVTSLLTVSLLDYSGGDLDVLLLHDPYPAALDAYGDTGFSRTVAPGTYYIVVDGLNGTTGEYWLSIDCEGEPTPTPTLTSTPTPTNTPDFQYYPVVYRMSTPTPTNTLTPSPSPTFLPYTQGVNCGSAQGIWGTDGVLYAPDQPYAQGSWGWQGGQAGFVTTTTTEIAGTADGPIYQSQRYGMNAYRFTVPRGRYEVLLRFAEIFAFVKVGNRVFSVDLEGQRVINQLDLLTKGARNRAWDQQFEIDVVDGVLDVSFSAQTQDWGAVINGIRVRRVGNAP